MNQKNTLLVLVATAGLSLKGIWARLAYAEGLDVYGVMFYRALLATPLFIGCGLFLLLRQRGLPPGPPRPAKAWLLTAALGSLFSLGMYSDFQAIAFLGAGVSRVILFGFPVVVMAVEACVRRQLPAFGRWLGFSVAWIGLCFVAGGNLRVPAHADGLIWGFASLVLYGLYVAATAPLSQQLGSVRFTVLSNTATGVVVLSVLWLESGGAAPPISAAALGWISLMVVCSTVVPYFLLTEGIRRLGGAKASLIAMLGPPFTVAAGWLTLDESLTGVQLVGCAAVLTGVYLTQSQKPPYVNRYLAAFAATRVCSPARDRLGLPRV